MYSSIPKLDHDVARSFLNAPSNTISYRPIQMNHEQQHSLVTPYQLINQETMLNNVLYQSHPNTQLDCSTINPMYYDVIIDTVTDYDIFYPIAKETKRYYNDLYTNDLLTLANNHSPCHIERLDEFAVSIDFPHDYELASNLPSQYRYESLYPMKTVRFDDDSKWIPYSKKACNPIDQYYFYPEKNLHVDNVQSSLRYITTPFFGFRPVLNDDCAICIPRSRPSFHAFITSPYDRLPIQYQRNSIHNSIRF